MKITIKVPTKANKKIREKIDMCRKCLGSSGFVFGEVSAQGSKLQIELSNDRMKSLVPMKTTEALLLAIDSFGLRELSVMRGGEDTKKKKPSKKELFWA